MSQARPPISYTEVQRREAADWFVVIRDEQDPKGESLQAWLKWMEQDEGNRAAFDAIAQTWQLAPGAPEALMPTANELLADDYEGDDSVASWLAKQSVADDIAIQQRSRAQPRMRRRVWLAAASVIVALAFGVHRYADWNAPRSDEFVTRIGEQMELTLADGSHVWLGPKSNLQVHFDETQRALQLTTGEAFFSVKKDPARPFRVKSAGGDIVAVGTAFNVRAVDEHITVAVSEGVVAVTPTAPPTVRVPTTLRVASGQQLTFSAQQPVKALSIVQSAAPGERAKWRDGVLVYRNESLADVVSDIVRYSDIQIEITDPAVGDLRYSGVIYHDAVREWVSALPESFPVTIESDGVREMIKAR